MVLIASTSNAQIQKTERGYITKMASLMADKYKINRKIVLSIIQVESSGRPMATGSAGEIGLMQLHPRWFPTASYNIRDNIEMGVKHLAFWKKYCPNKVDMSWVICYNIGRRKANNYKTHPYYKKFIRELRRK